MTCRFFNFFFSEEISIKVRTDAVVEAVKSLVLNNDGLCRLIYYRSRHTQGYATSLIQSFQRRRKKSSYYLSLIPSQLYAL